MLSETDAKAVYRKHKAEIAEQRLRLIAAENEHQRFVSAIALLGEIGDGSLSDHWANRNTVQLEQELKGALPSAIKGVWGGSIPGANTQQFDLDALKETYRVLIDTRDDLANHVQHTRAISETAASSLAANSITELAEKAAASDNIRVNLVNGASQQLRDQLRETFLAAVNSGGLEAYHGAIKDAFDATLADPPNQSGTWGILDSLFIAVALEDTADAFGIWSNEVANLDAITGRTVDSFDLYRRTMGEMTFRHEAAVKDYAALSSGSTIGINKQTDDAYWIMTPNNVIHELGHSFNSFAGLGQLDLDGLLDSGNINDMALMRFGSNISRTGMGYPAPEAMLGTDLWGKASDAPDVREIYEFAAGYDRELSVEDIGRMDAGGRFASEIDPLQHSPEKTTNEYSADAFLNWVQDMVTGNYNEGAIWHNADESSRFWLSANDPDYGQGMLGFRHDEAGNQWRGFMNEHMGQWLRNANLSQVLKDMPYTEQVQYFQSSGVLTPAGEVSTSSLNGDYSLRTQPEVPQDRSANQLDFGPSFIREIETDTLTILGVLDPNPLQPGDEWIQVYSSGRTLWTNVGAFSTTDVLLQPNPEAGFRFSPDQPLDVNASWQTDLITSGNSLGV
jgi:hypothetical protein